MITLLQLEYFRKLAATQHITQTAKELYISQTALSSMIIGLEKELGVQLFDRSKRSIHLNEAGKLYLSYVEQVFNALDNGHAALRDMVDAGEKQVSVAVGSSLVWTGMFRQFHMYFPDHALKQHNGTTAELSDALQSARVDFVIAGAGDIVDKALESAFVKTDNVYLCVPSSHRFAKREEVYMEELRDERFISLPVGAPWRSYCDWLFEKAGITTKPIVECDYTMRAALVESEFGVALTSSSALDVDLLRPNHYIRVADEYASRKMLLYWNPKRYMSNAARDFKEFCIGYWKEPQKTLAEPAAATNDPIESL